MDLINNDGTQITKWSQACGLVWFAFYSRERCETAEGYSKAGKKKDKYNFNPQMVETLPVEPADTMGLHFLRFKACPIHFLSRP